jgi:hypothetical protein
MPTKNMVKLKMADVAPSPVILQVAHLVLEEDL